LNNALLSLVFLPLQAALAMGLLELRPWKPRTVGALGIIASLINCYMLYPSVPQPLWAGWSWLTGSVRTPPRPALKTE
jgi:hypothetical protein